MASDRQTTQRTEKLQALDRLLARALDDNLAAAAAKRMGAVRLSAFAEAISAALPDGKRPAHRHILNEIMPGYATRRTPALTSVIGTALEDLADNGQKATEGQYQALAAAAARLLDKKPAELEAMIAAKSGSRP